MTGEEIMTSSSNCDVPEFGTGNGTWIDDGTEAACCVDP